MPIARTVWFNKGLSSVFNAIQTIRQEDHDRRWRVLCTHTHPDFAAFTLSDAQEVEPVLGDPQEYLEYCLDVCRRYAVTVFFPGRQAAFLAGQRERFAAQGTRLVACATSEIMALIEHKARFYDDLDPAAVAVPEYRLVNTLDGFRAAYTDLRERHEKVCCKPAVGVFGMGFRVIKENGNEIDWLLSGDAYSVRLEEACRVLGLQESFRDLLVMEYLPGEERSVDCLARHGELLRCVVRRKGRGAGSAQVLEEHAAVEAMARHLTARYGLHGLYNVQFREDAQGTPRLLEINTRMSGGLHYACLSGVALPWWCLRLEAGECEPDDVPWPRTGLRVGQYDGGLLLSATAAPSPSMGEPLMAGEAAR